jgi:hypothetical protein
MHVCIVFDSLLGFDGNEFYSQEWPEVVGVPFGALAERFENAIPLGIKTTYEQQQEQRHFYHHDPLR